MHILAKTTVLIQKNYLWARYGYNTLQLASLKFDSIIVIWQLIRNVQTNSSETESHRSYQVSTQHQYHRATPKICSTVFLSQGLPLWKISRKCIQNFLNNPVCRCMNKQNPNWRDYTNVNKCSSLRGCNPFVKVQEYVTSRRGELIHCTNLGLLSTQQNI